MTIEHNGMNKTSRLATFIERFDCLGEVDLVFSLAGALKTKSYFIHGSGDPTY